MKVVEWSANMMEEDAKRKLKAAELQAKKDRLKIWTTYVLPQTNSTAILDVNFSGKVRFDGFLEVCADPMTGLPVVKGPLVCSSVLSELWSS